MSSAYDHLSYAGFDLSNDITSTSFAQTASVNSDRVGLLSAPKSRISIVRDERDLGPIRFDDPPGPRKFALNLRSGWRVGAALASLGALITLIVNIAIGAWASSRKGLNSVGVLVELFRGDCDTAARLNTWSHLAINIVSTLLLAGSNYCMQCLVAPSRSDINRAHARGAWLDIGVPSLRNLGWIGWWRKSLWIILIISSLPLHLMFNSVFFTSIATHNYNVVFVTPNFTQGAPFSTASGRNTGAFQPPIWKENLTTVQQLVQDNRFERLENAECINAYAVDLQTSRRTLVVVSSNASIHDTRVHHRQRPSRLRTPREMVYSSTRLQSVRLDVRNPGGQSARCEVRPVWQSSKVLHLCQEIPTHSRRVVAIRLATPIIA